MTKQFTPPHICSYRSLFGEQYHWFGFLSCWCNKIMIYERPKESHPPTTGA